MGEADRPGAAIDARLLSTERRLALAMRAARLGVYEYHPASGRLEWDRRTRDLWGVEPDEPVDFDVFLAGVVEEDREAVADALARAFDAQGDHRYECDYRVRHRGTGEVRWVRAVGDAFFEDQVPVALFGTVADITETRAARRALEESEARLRLVLDSTLAFIGVMEPDGTMREANAPALLAGGLAREEVVGRKFWDCYWWSFDPAVQARLRSAIARAAAGEVVRYDSEVRMAGDTRITIDFMLSPVRDADGRVHLLVPSGFDISDRKAHEERIQLLMREVNHRSKNMLSVVRAVARQTQRASGADWPERFAERIDALAAGHDLLVRNEWRSVDMGELVLSQLAHFGDLIGDRVLIEGSPVQLGPRAAQAVGMAIHELATNAGKYGALSNETGQVRIWWGEGCGIDTAHFCICWREQGGPPVRTPDHKGFGSTVTDLMIRRSLGADVETRFDPDGLRWRVSCPHARLKE